MCETCGCSGDSKPRLTDLQTGATLAIDSVNDHQHHHRDHEHDNAGGHAHENHTHHHDHHTHHHDHDHTHGADHSHVEHDHDHSGTIHLGTQILAKNDRLAERNRGWFAGRNILALNLVSAPGAGKTTLLERTIKELGREFTLSVVEGDQATIHDSERIQATGCRVVQINTGTGCHLDAAMLARGLQQLDPPANSIVLVENVGNLVCPALFDLGESARVVIASVAEGDDKPIKYPHIFRGSQLMILNKIDLLPHVSFDVERCLEYVRQVNPGMRVIQGSATRGDGLVDWYAWLRAQASLSPSLDS
jgi:hydrogenase nickel incorporation protein HypB